MAAGDGREAIPGAVDSPFATYLGGTATNSHGARDTVTARRGLGRGMVVVGGQERAGGEVHASG